MSTAAKPKKNVELASGLKGKGATAAEAKEGAVVLAKIAEDAEASTELRYWAAYWQDVILHAQNNTQAREEAMASMTAKLATFA